MTPLGSPVLPLEKMTVARSSRADALGLPMTQARVPAGQRAGILPSARRTFSRANGGLAARSSRKTVSTGTVSFIFSRNIRDVMTVPSPHCCADRRRASLRTRYNSNSPAPCPAAARHDSPARPARDGGRKIPTIFWPVQIFFNRRARKTVLTSAAPKVTFGVCASAMANRRGCRRAVRTNCLASGFIRVAALLPCRGEQFLHGLRAPRTPLRSAAAAGRNSPSPDGECATAISTPSAPV